MKNLDILSYKDLVALQIKVQGELALLKLNDIKTDRTRQKERTLKKQSADIQGYLVLAKLDKKECVTLASTIIESILKAHGVYTDELHDTLFTRMTARSVDIYYNASFPELAKVKSKQGFKRWLKYKLQTLINLI